LGDSAHHILRVTLRGLSKKDTKRLAPSIQRLYQLYKLDLSGNGLRIGGVLAVGFETETRRLCKQQLNPIVSGGFFA
jgi:hypothetical protein